MFTRPGIPATKNRTKAPEMLVGVAGFEPATPASRTQCSTGLSHTPTETAAYSLGFRVPQGAEVEDFEPGANSSENAGFALRRGGCGCSRAVVGRRWPGGIPDRDR